MNYGKYIIVETMEIECPILFDNLIEHSNFLKTFPADSIVSAGFFQIKLPDHEDDFGGINVSTFGESITLNRKARHTMDKLLIENLLNGE